MTDRICAVNGIEYKISWKAELLSVVFIMSDFYYTEFPYLKSPLENSYEKEIRSYFHNCIAHPVFSHFKDIVSKGFCFDAPFLTLLCDEQLKILPQSQNIILNRLPELSLEELNNFFNELEQFKTAYQFELFFHTHFSYYDSLLDMNLCQLPSFNFVSILRDYHGSLPAALEVILAPTMGGVGFCISCNDKSSIVLGTYDDKDTLPLTIVPEYFIPMLFHEFSHSCVNTSVNSLSSLMNLEPLCMKMYDSLPKGYRAQYGSGNALLSEMIVRAVTIRLLFICQGQKQADAKLEFDISQGFTWVEPICRLLKEYEMQRTLYPSIDLFIPQLVHSLIESI